MSATTIATATILNPLIEICRDGEDGFSEAANKVKNADFKALFSELATQRLEYAQQLQKLVFSLGQDPETTGTFGGAVHRGWMDLKAALTHGDEHAILVECERGEDAAVAAYLEALEHGDLPIEVRAFLRQQYVGIQAAHDRVHGLRDRSANP